MTPIVGISGVPSPYRSSLTQKYIQYICVHLFEGFTSFVRHPQPREMRTGGSVEGNGRPQGPLPDPVPKDIVCPS